MKIKNNIDTLSKEELLEILRKYKELVDEFKRNYYKALSRRRAYDPYSYNCFTNCNEEYFAQREAFVENLNDEKQKKECRKLTEHESLHAEDIDGDYSVFRVVDYINEILNYNQTTEDLFKIIDFVHNYLSTMLEPYTSLFLVSSTRETYSFDEELNLVLDEHPYYSFDYENFILKRDGKEIASVSLVESKSDTSNVTYEYKTEDIVDLYYIQFYFSEAIVLEMQFQELEHNLSLLYQRSKEIHQVYLECNMD